MAKAKKKVIASFPNGLKFEIPKDRAKKIIELQRWIKSKESKKE